MAQDRCPSCNAEINHNAQFCNMCGRSLYEPSLSQQTAVTGPTRRLDPMQPLAADRPPVYTRPGTVTPAYQQAPPQLYYQEPQPGYQQAPSQPYYQQQPQPGYQQAQTYYQGPVQQVNVVMATSPTPAVIIVNQKSVAVALLLTFLFGPLGMFYSTVSGAITMLIVSVLLATLTLGVSILITWPICMIWAAVAASK